MTSLNKEQESGRGAEQPVTGSRCTQRVAEELVFVRGNREFSDFSKVTVMSDRAGTGVPWDRQAV